LILRPPIFWDARTGCKKEVVGTTAVVSIPVAPRDVVPINPGRIDLINPGRMEEGVERCRVSPGFNPDLLVM